MPQDGLARKIMAVDCSLDPQWDDTFLGSSSAALAQLYRDEESRGYAHPSEHLFKDAADRVKGGNSVEDTLAMMDEFGIEKAIVPVDTERPDEALRMIAKHPKRLYGKLGVNPMEGMEALRKIDDIVKGNPHIKALSVSPFTIQRPPNDKVYYPLYAKAIELDLPITMTVGLPGPRVPGEMQNPIYLDEPLWFFPELTIIMMHGGEPWEAMCVKLMLKWPNLYFMTSAFAPRHYPKDIVYYANTRGADKVMFAGYYPGLSYDRIQDDLQELALRDHVWPKFLRENATSVFKLDNA